MTPGSKFCCHCGDGTPLEKRAELAERDEEELEELPGDMSLLLKHIERWNRKSNSVLRNEMAELKTELTAKVEKVSEKIDVTDNSLKELAVRVQKLEITQSTQGTTSSVPDPWSIYRSRGHDGLSQHPGWPVEYKAQKIWIKGYICDWKAKDQSSLSSTQVKQWVNFVYNEMSDDIKQHVDVGASEKFANRVLFTKFSVCLKNVTDREVAWSVKAELERIWGENKCLINGVIPRATVPPSPAMEPYVAAGGKMLAILRAKGVSKEALKPQWGPPVQIFDVRNPLKPEKLADFEKTKGWNFNAAALLALEPSISVDEVKASLEQ